MKNYEFEARNAKTMLADAALGLFVMTFFGIFFVIFAVMFAAPIS